MVNGILEQDTKFEASAAQAGWSVATLVTGSDGRHYGYAKNMEDYSNIGSLTPVNWVNNGYTINTIQCIWYDYMLDYNYIKVLFSSTTASSKTLKMRIDDLAEVDITLAANPNFFSVGESKEFAKVIKQKTTHTIKYKIT